MHALVGPVAINLYCKIVITEVLHFELKLHLSMTIATVTTDINVGRFKIPANGQNMIMINYAQRNNLALS